MTGSLRKASLLVLVVSALLASHAALANVIWVGDFSTGDLSQWNGSEYLPGRIQVVPDPLGGNREAMQVLVKQGDDPINSSGNRNEIYYSKDRPANNSERWYHWQTLFPTSFQPASTWQLFTQWHQYGNGGSPPAQFYVNGQEIRLGMVKYGSNNMNDVWKTPLELGVWHDFVFHVFWSEDATQGFVEVYYDGKLVLPKTYLATLFPGDSVYLKQGLYRNASVTQDQTIYHTGMIVGTTIDDVWPNGPVTPPTMTTSGSTGTTTTGGSTGSTTGGSTGSTTGGSTGSTSGSTGSTTGGSTGTTTTGSTGSTATGSTGTAAGSGGDLAAGTGTTTTSPSTGTSTSSGSTTVASQTKATAGCNQAGLGDMGLAVAAGALSLIIRRRKARA